METRISGHRFLELTFKTTLGYFVFFLSFFSVPFAQALYQNFVDFRQEFVNGAYVVLAESKIKVEIVDEPYERARGLSGRNSLEANTGMLFVFEDPGPHGIWMKDMNFPIDIVWFNANREVIHIVKEATPESYPQTFKPSVDAMYVLELPAGFVSKEGIKVNDQLTIF